MPLTQRVLCEANAELRAAAAWYDDPDVGLRLLAAVKEARTLIGEMPDAWPVIRRRRDLVIRRKGVSGFPYGVLYYKTDVEVVIVAYAHTKRRPGYWKDRV